MTKRDGRTALFQEGFADLGKRFRPCASIVAKSGEARLLSQRVFLLSGIGVKRVCEKNSRAAANQKRNNERHEHYSCTNHRCLASFCFRTASLRRGSGFEAVTILWQATGEPSPAARAVIGNRAAGTSKSPAAPGSDNSNCGRGRPCAIAVVHHLPHCGRGSFCSNTLTCTLQVTFASARLSISAFVDQVLDDLRW
jgi:hypothetical protein